MNGGGNDPRERAEQARHRAIQLHEALFRARPPILYGPAFFDVGQTWLVVADAAEEAGLAHSVETSLLNARDAFRRATRTPAPLEAFRPRSLTLEMAAREAAGRWLLGPDFHALEGTTIADLYELMTATRWRRAPSSRLRGASPLRAFYDALERVAHRRRFRGRTQEHG